MESKSSVVARARAFLCRCLVVLSLAKCLSVEGVWEPELIGVVVAGGRDTALKDD